MRSNDIKYARRGEGGTSCLHDAGQLLCIPAAAGPGYLWVRGPQRGHEALTCRLPCQGCQTTTLCTAGTHLLAAAGYAHTSAGTGRGGWQWRCTECSPVPLCLGSQGTLLTAAGSLLPDGPLGNPSRADTGSGGLPRPLHCVCQLGACHAACCCSRLPDTAMPAAGVAGMPAQPPCCSRGNAGPADS